MIKNENEIVDLLHKQLNTKYSKIHVRKYPSNSKRVTNFLTSKLSYIPFLRPEIDMIFIEKSGHINAVEIKYFKNIDNKTPFYIGIDQALSLYRYGFDNVALWHFFSDKISINDINKYGSETWYFIRNSLQLRLNFSYFHIKLVNNQVKFPVLQYINRKNGFYLGCNIDDDIFQISFRYGNPLLLSGDKFTLIMREALLEYL